MRIISGEYKGRTFVAPKDLPVRPTTDMAKESLFNILRHYFDFDDIKALDLFSGLGGISLELISRGVPLVHAVEMNYKCIAFIKQTADRLGMKGLQVFRQNAFEYPKHSLLAYDFIFADPPYQAEEIKDFPDTIFKGNALAPEGIFILEHSRDYDFQDHPYFKELRHYGKVHFSIFSRR